MTTPLEADTGRPTRDAASAAAWLKDPGQEHKAGPTQAERWAAEPEWKGEPLADEDPTTPA